MALALPLLQALTHGTLALLVDEQADQVQDPLLGQDQAPRRVLIHMMA